MIVDSLDPRSNYLMTTGIAHVEEADLVLLIGANPRFELQSSIPGFQLDLALVGPKVELTYDSDHLGDSIEVLQQLADGPNPCSTRLVATKASNPYSAMQAGTKLVASLCGGGWWRCHEADTADC